MSLIIKYSDFFEDDGAFERLKKEYELLGEYVKKVTAQLRLASKGINPAELESVKELQVALEDLKKHNEKRLKLGNQISEVEKQQAKEIERLAKELKKQAEEVEKLRKAQEKGESTKKKNKDLTMEERIEIQKEREALRLLNLEARNRAKEQESQTGSINQLSAQLSLVTIEWNKLSEEERKNTARGQELTKQKTELTAALHAERSATGDNRMNVGNYKEAVEQLIVTQRKEQAMLTDLIKVLKSEQSTLQKGTLEYKVYEKEIQNTEKKLASLDVSLNETKASVEGLSKRFDSAKNILAAFGVTLGAIAIARNAFDTLVKFDEGLADIAKTTGLTIEQSRQLSESLLELDTRTPISELQGLAAAAGRLNIEGEANIRAFVGSADKLFVALGDDLSGSAEEIATEIGKITAIYGEEAEFGIEQSLLRAGSAVNSLAAQSKAAAQPILEFTTRVQGLANVITQQDAMALGAFFDEQGQSIEVASSTINTLLPKLATDYKRFAEVSGMAADDFKRLAEEAPIEALKAVAKGAKNTEKGVFNLAKTIESFGVDNARATSIVGALTNNIGRLGELQAISALETEKATSVLDEFNIKNETLGANVEKLKGAWDAFVISQNSAVGASSILSQSIGFLARNLSVILGTVFKLTMAFAAYRAVLAGMKLADRIKEQISYNRAMASGAQSTELATTRAKQFGQALKSIGIVAAIAVAFELARAFYDIASGAFTARKEAEAFNKTQEALAKDTEQNIGTISNAAKKSIDAQRRLLNESKISADEYYRNVQIILDGQKFRIENEKQILENTINDMESLLERLGSGSGIVAAAAEANEKYFQGRIASAIKQIPELKGMIKAYREELGNYDEALEALNENLKDNTSESIANTNATKENEKSKRKNTTALKENRSELQLMIDFLREEARLRKELADAESDTISFRLDKEIEAEIERLQKVISEFGVIDLSVINQNLKEINQLRRNALNENFKYSISEIDRNLANEKALRIEALQNERDELLKQENLTVLERVKIEASYQNRLRELDVEMLKQYELAEIQKNVLTEKYILEREKLEYERIAKQDEIDKKAQEAQRQYLETINDTQRINNEIAIEMLENSINEQEKVIEKAEGRKKDIALKALKELNAQRMEILRKQIELEYELLLENVEKGSAEETRLEAEKSLKLLKLKNEYASQVEEIDEKIEQNRADSFKKIISEITKFSDQLISEISKSLQKSVDAAQKLLEKQNKAVAHQQALAEKGLENTYIYEVDIQKKRELELREAQKRMEQLEKAKAFYAAFTTNVQNSKNSGEALVKTISDMAKLEVAIRAISGLGFKDGGYTGDVGVSQAAGHVHGQEFVLTAKQTAKYGLKGKSAIDFDKMYSKGAFAPKSLLDFNQISISGEMVKIKPNAANNKDVVNALGEIKELLKNSSSADLEALAKGIITTKSNKGNFVRRNSYINR